MTGFEPEIGRTQSFRDRTPSDEVWDRDEAEKEIYQAAYREAAEHYMRIFNASMAQIGSRLLHPAATLKDVRVDYVSVLIAHGSFLCDGKGPTEWAKTLGVEKATLSKNAVEFCVGNSLPPSTFMRDEDTTKAYREARLKVVRESEEL